MLSQRLRPERAGRGREQQLRQLARANTPTGVIDLKLQRTEAAIRANAQDLNVSPEADEPVALQPAKRSITSNDERVIARSSFSMSAEQPVRAISVAQRHARLDQGLLDRQWQLGDRIEHRRLLGVLR